MYIKNKQITQIKFDAGAKRDTRARTHAPASFHEFSIEFSRALKTFHSDDAEAGGPGGQVGFGGPPVGGTGGFRSSGACPNTKYRGVARSRRGFI